MSDDARAATRRELLAGLGVAGAATLTGYSTDARTPSGPHFRLGTLHPPVTLDPFVAKSVGSAQIIDKIFDGLYAYGDGVDIVPKIAAGDPRIRNDGREITVEIDEQARFQNDRAVTAEDVKYSFEAPLEEDAASAWQVSPIASVETPDDRTVRFTLEKPYPDFGHALTRPIVPKDVRKADPERFATEPVGAGPFEVRTFTEETKATLSRWEGYWDDPKPAVATFTAVYVESPITQMMGLRTNRTDAFEPISPQLVPRVADVTGGSVKKRRGYTSFYLGFNLNEGPTTDPRVREAISFCIDPDKVVEHFIEPMGERQYGPLPPHVARDWNMPIEEWKSLANRKNLRKARRLLREADEASGQFVILTSKDPKQKEIGEALAGGLRDAGHGALVVSEPSTVYLEKYVSGSERDYTVFVGETAGTPDPDSVLYPTFHENMAGKTNGTFYREDAVMERLSAARETRNRRRRRRLYRGAIAKLLEDRVCVPLCSFENSFAVAEHVKHFRVHPISQVNPRLVNENSVVTVRR